MTTIVTAAVLVTGHGVLRPGWLEITGGTISALGQGPAPRPLAEGDRAFEELTIVPGFVDMHIHGGGGSDFSQATDEATVTVTNTHARHGTTSMGASLVSAYPEELLRQVDVLSGHVRDGLLAEIHLEGPWLAPSKKGAHDLAALRRPDSDELDRVLCAARGTVPMVTLAPELPGAMDAIRRTVDEGAVAAVGHTDATYEQTLQAIDAGARVGTHLFNAMRPVHHREPFPITALVEDPRVTVEIICDGVHLHPSLYRVVTEQAGPHRVALVTDAMSAAGMPDGSYRLGSLAVSVTEGVAQISGTDTIAGSTATMDRMFQFALKHGPQDPDLALLDAVRQTSVNPARAMGLSTVGLHVGGRADVVALNHSSEVVAVFRGDEEI